MKNAIITGGQSYHQNFFTNQNGKYKNFFNKRIYILDLEDVELKDFDYLVLSSRLNLSYLFKNKHKLESYLDNGGNIVSFGEIKKPLFRNIHWQDYPTNFWWWVLEGSDLPLYAKDMKHQLFKFLDVDECKWHYHGAFYPPTGSEEILVNEIGESIIYKDTISYKGSLYVTSLDPDYHIGQGFMPKTVPFFDKFMAWVESDITKKSLAKNEKSLKETL
ncbi:hypothetical protein BKH43_01325 [Helicobacter sp. 13S00401-1]|uniref:hypothetical protein n=1 Tax=Helicobacter sp. 13S00401-1 TaxID=1905758 RepID=UPI000BA5DA3D|nr:hypothetical protein [Helicobacter sp. 13S00401-1]PAF51900.1 hypothetical protein BKH43_01325 [Helicobacter sp. 13S00401-1]